MNKPAKVHIVWGAVAVSAFLAGYFVLPSSSDERTASIPRRSGEPGSVRVAGNSDSGRTGSALKGAQVGNGTGETGKLPPLSVRTLYRELLASVLRLLCINP